MFSGLPVEFGLEHGVFNGVGSFFSDARDCAERARIQHNFVLVDEGVFVDRAENVATGDVVPNLSLAGAVWVKQLLRMNRRTDRQLELTFSWPGVKSHLSDLSRASVLIPRGM